MKVVGHNPPKMTTPVGSLQAGDTFLLTGFLPGVHILLKPHRAVKLEKGFMLVADIESGFTYPIKKDIPVLKYKLHAVESAA